MFSEFQCLIATLILIYLFNYTSILLYILYQEQGDYVKSRFATKGKTTTCSNAKSFVATNQDAIWHGISIDESSVGLQKFTTAIEIKQHYSQVIVTKPIADTEHLLRKN